MPFTALKSFKEKMSRGMLLHTIDHTAICVSHSPTHSDRCMDDGVLRRWSWRSGTLVRRGHRGLDTTNTKQLLHCCPTCSKRNTCRVSIWRARAHT